MQEKTKEYIKDSLDWIEIQVNTLEEEFLSDIRQELRKLKKIYKKVISKL